MLGCAPQMLIGEQMKVSGAIEGDEDLVVRGRVEGTVRITGTLTVEPGGFVGADVQARAVAIYGTLVGNVAAAESIEVARSGQMIGDVVAPRVAIVPGAAFRGRLEMGELHALASGALPSLPLRESAPSPPAAAALPPRRAGAADDLPATAEQTPLDIPPAAERRRGAGDLPRKSQTSSGAHAEAAQPSSDTAVPPPQTSHADRRSLPRGSATVAGSGGRGESPRREVPRLATPPRGPIRRR